jgi:serine/threonine-protein kinase
MKGGDKLVVSYWSGKLSELVGKQLKDYYVLRRLGSGAMAEVYLAQQQSLARQIALKVLNAELARDPTYVRRFHHEARAAAALAHPSIVQIYEVGEDGGVHFIAQEYVPGRNLAEMIRGQGRLAAGLVLDVMRQVATAIAKADSEGIVHRDIKPENIMLARTGEVKVADFGLARVQGDGGLNLTQIGVTMGTPLYMSPEQIEGRELDGRSDVYSLGVTAYHMLAGVPPFEGDTPLAVAVQHLNQPPRPLAERCVDVPDALAALIHRMLAKRPADRFASPAELLTELQAVAQQGVAEGWAAPSDHGSLVQMVSVADDRAAATSRLAKVMHAGRRPARHRWSPKWVAMGLVSVLTGGFLAYLARPDALLADAAAGPRRFDKVWEQLYHAKIVDTPETWQAVEIHFGDEGPYYRRLAKQGLALCYLLRTQEYDKAVEPLRELANLGDDDRAMRAIGIAGLVVAEAELKHFDSALHELGNLSSEMRAMVVERAPQLDELLAQTLEELGRPGR